MSDNRRQGLLEKLRVWVKGTAYGTNRPVNFATGGGATPAAAEATDSPYELTITLGPGTISGRITVAKVGGNYTTFAAAIAASAAGDVIYVYPGTYAEANPLTLKDDTSLVCVADHEQTLMTCDNAGSVGMIVGDDCHVHGLGISGATTAAAFNLPATTTHAVVRSCAAIDSQEGFDILSTSGRVWIHNCTVSGTGTNGVRCSAGGITIVTGFLASGATLTNAVLATGASSNAKVSGSVILGATVTNGLHALTGGKVEALALHIDGGVNGIRVGATGTVVAGAVDIDNTTTWDIITTAASSRLFSLGVRALPTKVSRTAGDMVIGPTVSDLTDDEGTTHDGQFAVGRRGFGAELVVGEGDSDTLGMHVFTNDNAAAGSWVDETADASSATGSTFTLFPGVTANNTCYFGHEDAAFPNIKVKLTTAITLGAAGVIAWEYWDGGAWSDLDIMATDADAPYGQYAEQAWQRGNQSDQIRFKPPADWASSTLDGRGAFWIRCRITTAITTSPVIEQVKIGTNRTEINKDGKLEFFGDNAVDVRVVDIGEPHALTGAGAPSATTISVSATVAYSGDAYRASQGDGVVFIFAVPAGLDTSRDLTFKTVWKPSTNNGGNAVIRTTAIEGREGDNVAGALTETTVDVAQAASGVVDDIQTITENVFCAPDVVPGDVLWIAHLRPNIGADTYTGNVEILKRELTGSFWR